MGLGGLTGAGLVVSSSVIGGGPRLGDFYGWQADDLDAAIAEAGDNLVLGTRLATTEQDWYALVQDAPTGTHYLPRAVPVSTTQAVPSLREVLTAWRGVDPVAASVSNWNKASEAGTPTYSVTSGVLTIEGTDSGDTARLNHDNATARLPDGVLIVVDDLSAVSAAASEGNRPSFQFRSSAGSGKYLQFRPQGNTASDVWGIALNGGSSSAITGFTIGTAHRVEIWWRPSTDAVRIRVDGGSWLAPSVTLPTLGGVTTAGAVLLAPYGDSSAQSISLASMFIGEVT